MTFIINGGNVSPFVVQKDWGEEVTYGISQAVALKRLDLRPGKSLSRQVHLLKDEIYAVLQGSGLLELGDHGEIVHALSAGDAIHLPPGVTHRLIAGHEGVVIIEASTPEINDIVRVEDAYNRQVNPQFDASIYRLVLRLKPASRIEQGLAREGWVDRVRTFFFYIRPIFGRARSAMRSSTIL
jgi:mannose-6-phosphate isomerase